ncbi:MAG TPA: transferrin receptor-like dimerization domain-containing protein, partial [Terriglobales bacterium]|nr:transferrin receptor-like dimerization domain-containing protein [Terriglobales bacterium]
YTPFLQHLGVPSVDMSFGGDYGVYHSAYDSFYWMAHFGDPTFQYHVAAAQIWGTVALRLADAAALPLDYTDYATQLREFVNETNRLANRKNLGGAFDSKSMLGAIDDFADEAAKLDRRRRDDLKDDKPAQLQRINEALIQAERALVDDRGLRGRTWYKHQIYAPGFYTGYAALPLPDLRQAIEDGRSADAAQAADRITAAIKRAAEVLKKGREG